MSMSMSMLRRYHSGPVAAIRRAIHRAPNGNDSVAVAPRHYLISHFLSPTSSSPSWLTTGRRGLSTKAGNHYHGLSSCVLTKNWEGGYRFSAREVTSEVRCRSFSISRARGGGGGGPTSPSQSHYPSSHSQKSRTKSKRRGPDMRNCQSIEEIARMAYEHLNVMSHQDISAFWTLASKLLSNNNGRNNYHNHHNHHDRNNRNAEDVKQLARQLNSIFGCTMDQLKTFRPRELAQTALGFARIANMLESNHEKFRGNNSPAHPILHGILVGQNSEHTESIFKYIATTSMRMRKLKNFDAQCLCNLAYANAIIIANNNNNNNFINLGTGNDGRTLFDHIAEKSIPLLETFRPQTFSNMVWSFEKVGSAAGSGEADTSSEHSRRLFDHVADHIVALANLDEFKPQELSNTLLAYAKLTREGEEGDTSIANNNDNNNQRRLFEKVADHIVQLDDLRQFKPQELSNILWAYAKTAKQTQTISTSDTTNHLFDKVAHHIITLRNLRGFNSNDLSNIAWVFVNKAGGGESKKSNNNHNNLPLLLEKVANHIITLDNLRSFELYQLSKILQACATTATETKTPLFEKVANHIVTQIKSGRRFEAQDLSSILSAFAKAEQSSHPKLFKEVANAIIANNDDDDDNNLAELLGPRSSSSLLWAFAKCDQSNPRLFKEVADHMIASLFENKRGAELFNAQDLSNTVWAFATAKESNPRLFKQVADHIVALDHLDEFAPQSLSNICLAFSKAGETNVPLFDTVAEHIVALDDLTEFKPQELSNLVWAYSNARVSSPLLFEKIKCEAIARQSEFKPQDISTLLWSYAAMGDMDSHLFSSMEATVSKCFVNCNVQHLTTIAWAYAVANVDAPNLFGIHSTFVNACIHTKHEFTNEDLFQLHQWCLWQKELKSDIDYVTLPPTLEEQCYKAFISRVPTESALQNDVLSVLSSMGLQPKEEALTGSGYLLDALVEVDGNKKIGIEVDGPFHFVGNKQPTGSTILKRRQVASLDGIPVVSVPYWEWDKRKKDHNKKERYLRDLLGLDESVV